GGMAWGGGVSAGVFVWAAASVAQSTNGSASMICLKDLALTRVPAKRPPVRRQGHVSMSGDLDILHLAVGRDPPGLDAVVMVDRVDAADLSQGLLARLHVAGVVDRARLQE